VTGASSEYFSRGAFGYRCHPVSVKMLLPKYLLVQIISITFDDMHNVMILLGIVNCASEINL